MASNPRRTARKVFIDSSVFFAAAYSTTGSAHDLLQAALAGRVLLVVSELVLQETERNLDQSAPAALPAFDRLRSALPYQLSTPSKRLIVATATTVAIRDAAIVAGARSARCQLLATYDRKHLLSQREVIQATFGITVGTPDDILTLLGLR